MSYRRSDFSPQHCSLRLEYARTQICACRRGVRTRACRVETLQEPWRKLLNPKKQPRQGFCRQRRSRQGSVVAHLDAWVSRTEICDKRGTGVEMSLVSTLFT